MGNDSKYDIGGDTQLSPLSVPKQGQYPQWDWETETNTWIGSSTLDLKRKVTLIKKLYSRRSNPPIYSSSDWQLVVSEFQSEFTDDKAEFSVQVLASILFDPLKNHKCDRIEDARFAMASIRCQRGEASCRAMYDSLDDLISGLDGNPCLADKLIPIFKTRGHQDTMYDFVPSSRLTKALISLGLEIGKPKRRMSSLEIMDVDLKANMEKLDPLDPTLESVLTFQEKLEKSSHDPQHGNIAASARAFKNEGISEKVVVSSTSDFAGMKLQIRRFKALQRYFDQLLADDEALIELWVRMDLNLNHELGFSEVQVFMQNAYPVLSNRIPLKKAFDECAENMAISPPNFSKFMYLMFYYCKIWLAFDLIDWNSNKELSQEEFESGNAEKIFKLVLNVANANFQAIARVDSKMRKDQMVITYESFCKWFYELHPHLYRKITVPEKGTITKADTELQYHSRLLDMDALCRVVLHCHYRTRCCIAETTT